MPKLSDTALTILNTAAQRDDRIAELPSKLPAAARNAVARSLTKQGLLAEGEGNTLRLTDEGFRALDLEPPGTANTGPTGAPTAAGAASVQAEALAVAEALEAAHSATVAAPRSSLRQVATAVLDAWDHRAAQPNEFDAALVQLRAVVLTRPGRAPRDPNTPRKPREGTKQQTVLALLRRQEGATVAQVVATTAWAQHTVRGFLANLKRKGITVEVLERVRVANADGTGTKGSYSIYRIADAG